MTFRCACGRELAAPAQGGVRCPACGAAYEARPGWRLAACECGARVPAAPAQVGTSIPCVACFLRVAVAPDAPPAPPAMTAPPRAPAPREAPPPRWRSVLRGLFPLALLPLLVHVCTPRTEEPLKELIHRAKADPRVQERYQPTWTLDDVFRALETDRIGAAWQSRFSMEHWVFAMAAAGGFFGLILLLFPLGRAHAVHLWTVGLLMGTFGVLMLLGLQWLSLHVRPGLNPLYLVGRAYRAAFSLDAGFFASWAGFTFGVGLCEELVKLLPLLVLWGRAGGLDARGAVAWGLAMGAGFGVSEAIHYSGELYNGLAPARIYLVRFVSVVALHMVWSGTAAARLWARRREPAPWYSFPGPLMLAIVPSVALHGLYDVLSKHGADFSAFCFALLSFIYFIWTTDRPAARMRPAAL